MFIIFVGQDNPDIKKKIPKVPNSNSNYSIALEFAKQTLDETKQNLPKNTLVVNTVFTISHKNKI